jgi:hypothetical protein
VVFCAGVLAALMIVAPGAAETGTTDAAVVARPHATATQEGCRKILRAQGFNVVGWPPQLDGANYKVDGT